VQGKRIWMILFTISGVVVIVVVVVVVVVIVVAAHEFSCESKYC